MSDPRPLVGRYRFGRRFEGARGAVVWLAIDEQTGAPVVVSLVPATRAYALGKALGVKHRHLTAILEIVPSPEAASMPEGVSVRGDTAAVVAEHVAGEALYAKLEEGPLPQQEAIRVVSHLAAAMAALHQARAVHGNFSPLSVVIARADHGLTPMMTQVLMPPLGAFASPERVRGEGASLVDDVWALHATLYAALTGRAPLRLDSGQISFAHESIANFGVADELLDQVIERGLDPSPETRTTKIEDLEADLVVWLSRQTTAGITAISARAPANPDAGRAAIPAGPIRKPTLKGLDAIAIAKAVAETARAGRAPARAEEESAGEARTEAPAEASVAPTSPLESAAEAAEPAAAAPEVPEAQERSLSPVSLDAATLRSAPRDRAPEPASAPSPEPGPVETAPELEAAVERAPSPPPPDAAELEPTPSTPDAPPPTPDAPEAIATPRARRGLGPKEGVMVGVLLAAILFEVVVWRGGRSTASAPTTAPTAAASAQPLASSAAATAAETATAALETGTAPSAPAASMFAPGDPSSCVAGFFLPGTFLSPQDLTPVCGTSDARGLIRTLYTRLVVAGAGNATRGMKEWAMLEWYELAAFAVMRGACCPGAPPIALPPAAPPCEPLGPTLDRLADASAKHADVELRVLGFDKNVMCLMGQLTRPYRYTSHPYAGGQAVFSAFLKRSIK